MNDFTCPWCDYAGSEALYHLREKHPEKMVTWMRDYANKPEEAPVEKPNHEEIVDIIPITQGHTITRRLEFDAGHRVHMHESKCANIHGHRYVALVTCSAEKLDDLGRVIDFSVIKGLVGKWIDDKLDHGMILFKDDPLVKRWLLWDHDNGDHGIQPQKHFVMDSNPTAENMSELIYDKAAELLAPHNIKVNRVTLYETPNCFATYPGE